MALASSGWGLQTAEKLRKDSRPEDQSGKGGQQSCSWGARPGSPQLRTGRKAQRQGGFPGTSRFLVPRSHSLTGCLPILEPQGQNTGSQNVPPAIFLLGSGVTELLNQPSPGPWGRCSLWLLSTGQSHWQIISTECSGCCERGARPMGAQERGLCLREGHVLWLRHWARTVNKGRK